MRRKKIKKIIKMFEKSSLTKMEMEFKRGKITMEKATPSTNEPMQTKNTFQQADNFNEKGTWVLSPLVGTYYDAVNRSTNPFVCVGDEIKENDVLCVIEAMKIMNELRSKISGRVIEIAVTNQSMVQYNQPLIKILEYD